MEDTKEASLEGIGNNALNKARAVVESVVESQEILKVLIESKSQGKSIAIASDRLGEGFVITAVEDILLVDGETIIRFKPYDITGFMLPTNKLSLSQISAVCAFRSEFENPVLKNLDKAKNWFY
jgi:hypothetical protein